ncbi:MULTISPECIES: hypothetical protein [unclassified Acinetobacter]|uniref:hypothetical protein n=1 Tax=unclassified Acinetobacter TaxID=196816 RepID=UPI0024479A0D|nr:MULTISPECIES: hypothetical protein [unclassified Acinetobacter]MDH0030636.1 hypothetical protein [Acinetobacter sp. GD04021]MDH0886253.1 hypothetical protein [Acinetobacter sp. GD03873]MDH1081772.1 hypothetical protein [Acinetobacter sp. GD03983]MDH2189730.1 hypothetical protein [Acinetobacter sp. GD03645]MDH2202722.1 hypothetical protein [Acinetobacter sp. GD03647]
MSVYINRNDTQYEVFEIFNIILKDNDIATIESDEHEFKILVTFINDDSGKMSWEYKYSEEHECPFLYFKNWNNQRMAFKKVLHLGEVTKSKLEIDSDVEIEAKGKLGLQVFVQRTTEVINATLQFVFEYNQDD